MSKTVILLKENDLTINTIIQGNVDTSKYFQDAKTAQTFKVKPLLGKELYDKICNDFEEQTLKGLYLELYDDYVKYLVVNGASELYLKHAAYQVTNAGVVKAKSESFESVDKNEIDFLLQACRDLFNLYSNEMLEWLNVNPLPEYKEVGSSKITTSTLPLGGWHFNKRNRTK